MRLTKLTHACVRLTDGDRCLVLDPGSWSEPDAVDGAQAVLLTHEHPDHVDVDRLTAACRADPALRVWAPAEMAGRLADLGDQVSGVGVGESFTAAGFAVTAVGDRHARIHGDVPDLANLGYVVDGTVYHPGDAFAVPAGPVEAVLVPTSGPWMKLGEAMDFLAAVDARQAFSVHDGLLNERAEALVDRYLGEVSAGYRRLRPGDTVDL